MYRGSNVKNVFILLQFVQLFCGSVQYCKEILGTQGVIDKWWTYSNSDIQKYKYQITCDDIPDEEILARYNDCSDGVSCCSMLEISNYHINILNTWYIPRSISKYCGIKMKNLGIQFVDKDTFFYVKNVKEINLQQNKISMLPRQLFTANTKLQTIDLSYNNISLISDNVIFPSNSVLNLNLKQNKLHSLSFTLPKTLINLDLSFNLISDIPENIFLGMTSLVTLSLDNNNLKIITDKCFEDLKQLQFLSIANNKISSFSPHNIFFGLHKIIHLNLSNNYLDDISNLIAYFSENLKILHIENNIISSIEADAFLYSTNVEEINLHQNKISFLPDNLFTANTKLKSIDLSSNIISIILGSSTFPSNSYVNLTLKENKLQSLNFTLPNTLTSLDLGFNLISEISKDFFLGMTSLEALSLENNNLKNVPAYCFKGLNKLHTLSLANNKIGSVSPYITFSGLHMLTNLDFSNNNLKDISDLITHSLANLQMLNIENNLISSFDTENISKILKRLRYIDIEGNNLTCSYLEELLFAFTQKNIVVKEGHEVSTTNIKGIKCTDNSSNGNKVELESSIKKMNTSQLISEGNSLIRIERIVYFCFVFLILNFVVLTIIISVIISILFYKRLCLDNLVHKTESLEVDNL